MDLDEARTFLTDNHRGILITRRSDGGLQTSPIAVGVDAEGRAVISSRETAFKTKNLMRDPRAVVCAFTNDWYGRFVQIEGTVEVAHQPEALELLVDYYRRIAGEHPDWDDYREAMKKERRVLLRITIERAGPDRSG